MESHFLGELEQLKMNILEMAAQTERAVAKAIRAFVERNAELAESVIQGDREINLMEVHLDRSCLRLLALDQPMARDLRFVVGCMKIAVDLERIADQAVNFAQRAHFLSNRPPLPANPSMEHLTSTALDMLRKVIAAFIREDVDQAREICQMDDIADEANLAVLRGLLDYMMKVVPAVERSVHTIIAARCMERVADQATNIAESVIFIVEGVNIKHHCGH